MIPFVSPKSGKNLHRQNGFLISDNGEKFPVVNDIPRFVPLDNYAAAFGLQWNTFSKTQHDEYYLSIISKERLERCLGFLLSELKGKNLLEVGSGSGRFTELLVKSGANVHSVDLSNAVEANKKNVGDKNNYTIAQASVYELPFPKASFDVVICLGVIQHTPSSEKTIQSLWEMVKPGGMITIDHYRWRLSYYFNLKPLWRHYYRKMPAEKSMKLIKKKIDYYFPLHWKYRKNKMMSWLIHRISPLIEYINMYPDKDYNWHYEMSYLDSYDSLTDYYKHLRTEKQIYTTLKKLGAQNIQVWRGGNGVEARATRIN
jgi:ubiquinone/menaquinone biosynthesis C-methylase UbiE